MHRADRRERDERRKLKKLKKEGKLPPETLEQEQPLDVKPEAVAAGEDTTAAAASGEPQVLAEDAVAAAADAMNKALEAANNVTAESELGEANESADAPVGDITMEEGVPHAEPAMDDEGTAEHMEASVRMATV